MLTSIDQLVTIKRFKLKLKNELLRTRSTFLKHGLMETKQDQICVNFQV